MCPWLREHNERKDVYRAPVLTLVVEFSTVPATKDVGAITSEASTHGQIVKAELYQAPVAAKVDVLT